MKSLAELIEHEKQKMISGRHVTFVFKADSRFTLTLMMTYLYGRGSRAWECDTRELTLRIWDYEEDYECGCGPIVDLQERFKGWATWKRTREPEPTVTAIT